MTVVIFLDSLFFFNFGEMTFSLLSRNSSCVIRSILLDRPLSQVSWCFSLEKMAIKSLKLSLSIFIFSEKRIINMDYHLPFLCFSVDNILLLLSCILTQQRIIFLASDYSLLTPIIEVGITNCHSTQNHIHSYNEMWHKAGAFSSILSKALLSYIQPLIWSLTYVPVLPRYMNYLFTSWWRVFKFNVGPSWTVAKINYYISWTNTCFQ